MRLGGLGEKGNRWSAQGLRRPIVRGRRGMRGKKKIQVDKTNAKVQEWTVLDAKNMTKQGEKRKGDAWPIRCGRIYLREHT